MPDEPIVVTGGSVSIDFSDTLQHQIGAPSGTQRYSGAGTLVSVQINEDEPIKLTERDVVTIIYNTD